MNLPGNNELALTEAAMCAALEDALNGTRKDGGDFIRVTGVKHTYSYPQWIVTITTDPPVPAVVDLPGLREVA